MLQIFWKPALLSFVSFSLLLLSSCSEKGVPPTAEQTTELTKTITACKRVTVNKPRLSHLAEYRRDFGTFFTCEDLERDCNINYTGDLCASEKMVVRTEIAFEKACRRNRSASNSAACTKLVKACNVKGFQSDECVSAIQPYRP